MHLTALALFMTPWDSPFIVPVAGCLMILGIVVSGVWSGNRSNELKSQERLAAIARGVPLPPTVEELAIIHGKPSIDGTRRRGNTRRAGIILLGSAAGLILFFFALASILQVREVLCGAAAGLIPLGIGVGFLVDARIQTRELEEAAFNHQSAPSVDPR
jgi:hypothetical protein